MTHHHRCRLNTERREKPQGSRSPLGVFPASPRVFQPLVQPLRKRSVGYEPKLTAFPGDRRPRSLRRGFHPGPPCSGSFGRIRFRTLIGFYTNPPQVSLRRPHRVAPLRKTNNATTRSPAQAKSLVRFRELFLLFATAKSPLQGGQQSEAMQGGARACEPRLEDLIRSPARDRAVPGSQAHTPP